MESTVDSYEKEKNTIYICCALYDASILNYICYIYIINYYIYILCFIYIYIHRTCVSELIR